MVAPVSENVFSHDDGDVDARQAAEMVAPGVDTSLPESDAAHLPVAGSPIEVPDVTEHKPDAHGAHDEVSPVNSSDVPSVPIPQTGEPRVDAALAALGDVDPSAPSDAVAPLGQVYDRLHRVLTQP